MHTPALMPFTQFRLIETWLPLAQVLNERYGWGDDGLRLEQLIIESIPALLLCSSTDEAHLVLFIARGGRWQRPSGR